MLCYTRGMGYEMVTFRAVADLSRHNSERDREHNELWNDFLDRVDAICEEEKYRPILLNVMEGEKQ